jgi:hypothetical protein
LRTRLPQRMLQRECLDLHAGIVDTPCQSDKAPGSLSHSILALVKCATKQISAMLGRSPQTEVSAARVARQRLLDRVAACIKPVPEPLRSSWLIEMKLVRDIFVRAGR